MLDYIASIIIRFLNIIFNFIPISISLWLGRRLGSIAFIFNKKRRLIAYANLKAAFCKEKSPAELRAITKRTYQNLVETFIEILNLTKVDKGYTAKYVEIVNFERVEDAARSGRGVILLTAHFGDWELLSLTSAMVGFPITVLVREQKMKRVNELLNRLRESKGCKVVRKGISTKNLLRALYDKNIVGILSDQDAGRDGVFVDFFGRPTSCHSGTMEMAKRTDSIILPNFIVRTHGPYHKVFLEEYIDFRLSNPSTKAQGSILSEVEGSKDGDDIKENLQKYATLLEGYVRRYPDQWLWLHKRWKSTPRRTVLVLNDGKTGHLNQSLAVAREIQKARATQGYKLDDTRIITVDVKFKSPILRSILTFSAAFASWRCHGRMRWMRICLEKETYETLMKTYSEFVVSCGSSLTAVNIYMSKENNAKNIIIMKPDILIGLKKFSLAVIPKHDNPPKAKNVLVTTIAPNMIDEEALKRNGEMLKERIKLEKRTAVGVLIGGDNPEYSLTRETIGDVIEGLLKFCDNYDTELLITTSRRTPREVEAVLKERLKGNHRCKLLVIANEANINEAVGGILSSSSIVVVSGESISMVSEAVTSRKKVIAFELEKKAVSTKHERALKELERRGYITVCKAGELASTIERVHREGTPARELIDNDRLFEAVRRLI